MQTKVTIISKSLPYKDTYLLQNKILKSFFTKLKSLQISKYKYNLPKKYIPYVNFHKAKTNLIYKLKKKGKFLVIETKNKKHILKETIYMLSLSPLIETLTNRNTLNLRPNRSLTETFLKIKTIIKQSKPIYWVAQIKVNIKNHINWLTNTILYKKELKNILSNENCLLIKKINNFLLSQLICYKHTKR